MSSNVVKLNNLTPAANAALSDLNEKAKQAYMQWPNDDIATRTADMEPWQYSGWFLFVPDSYLAMLDKNKIRLCVRYFEHSYTSRGWAE